MRWILALDGGPERVNHAAVVLGDKVYMFGGFSGHEYRHGGVHDLIDVYALNLCEFFGDYWKATKF